MSIDAAASNRFTDRNLVDREETYADYLAAGDVGGRESDR